ncbi:MAG TPA: hypothetical protein VEA61_05625 [Allosphingosinicella sp.]|nr:hypothetical protein [Allosphingosinicella sp.]
MDAISAVGTDRLRSRPAAAAFAAALLLAAPAPGRADPPVERPAAAPLIPFNSNFWSYWTHYWATWLPDHPVYEMIELTAWENPKDPSDRLVRIFLTERAGRKRQYFYLDNEAETRRSRANSHFRDIEYSRSGGPGRPQNLLVAFTDKDGVPIRWRVTFGPEARLRDHGAGLTPSIHSVGGVLLFALRTRTADTHDDEVRFGGVDYASQRPAEDRTPGTRSWFNPDYYSAVLVHGKATFSWRDGVLTNSSWGRTFTPAGGARRFRSQVLGPDNFIRFDVDRHGGLRRYAHFSRGHSLNFAFRPALPAPARARDGDLVRFGVSFDDRRALMTGTVRIARPEPGLLRLDWVPSGPAWAVGRDFRSELRLQGSGYELATAETRAPD